LTLKEVQAIRTKGGSCDDASVLEEAKNGPEYPVYFLSHSDAGSGAMRDAFVASLRKHDKMLLREVRAGVMSKNQIARSVK
jgi:hypothetical protein